MAGVSHHDTGRAARGADRPGARRIRSVRSSASEPTSSSSRRPPSTRPGSSPRGSAPPTSKRNSRDARERWSRPSSSSTGTRRRRTSEQTTTSRPTPTGPPAAPCWWSSINRACDSRAAACSRVRSDGWRRSDGDRLALLALPSPGPAVDFTTDHAKVLAAFGSLKAGVGRVPPPFTVRNVSVWEAFQIMERNDVVRAEVIARECRPGDASCPAEVTDNARAITADAVTQVQPVLEALRRVLRGLGALPGPKHVVLISAGWPIEERDATSRALVACCRCRARECDRARVHGRGMGDVGRFDPPDAASHVRSESASVERGDPGRVHGRPLGASSRWQWRSRIQIVERWVGGVLPARGQARPRRIWMAPASASASR